MIGRKVAATCRAALDGATPAPWVVRRRGTDTLEGIGPIRPGHYHLMHMSGPDLQVARMAPVACGEVVRLHDEIEKLISDYEEVASMYRDSGSEDFASEIQGAVQLLRALLDGEK